MPFEHIISFVLRLAELAFAAIVAGITGDYLHQNQGASSWDLGRWIYTEVVAGLSIFFAIIWLFPFASSFIHWPTDLLISICWFVSFGLLVNVSLLCSAKSCG
jgi:Membrane-associating domain